MNTPTYSLLELEEYALAVYENNPEWINLSGVLRVSAHFRSLGGNISFGVGEKSLQVYPGALNLELNSYDTIARTMIDIAAALGHYYLHCHAYASSSGLNTSHTFMLNGLDDKSDLTNRQAYDFGLMLLIPQGKLLEALSIMDKAEDFQLAAEIFNLYPNVIQYRYEFLS